ncbi:Lnb N-terminal periplasmic domain-containing protein [Halomonas sp. PBN3]|uniref:Lnb N-terminal periplasmic domain-containing protein n=1 Tax=Halomonas sp. PBN3 TaxID=1397528 RepID=UPI0003B900CD|nr:DUF4105 domain-containing protein [Halomonas sp. PBN3]ERS84211.1 hypothetical protein Q671_10435 [Halomonas sp. PBN3]
MSLLLDLALRLALVACALWGALALAFRFPAAPVRRRLVALGWLLLLGLLLAWHWQGARIGPALCLAVAMGTLLCWWRRLQPAGDLDWADDVAHLATGRVVGDRLVLDRVRRFDWCSRDQARTAWERREYDLTRLASLDLIVSAWGRPGIAHVLLSFGFADETGEADDFVAFSVEVRRERHEPFSELGGFFKRFELAIIAADERDAVRLRSNVRGERVTLYRTMLGERERRQLLLALVEEANRLALEPRFYHTIRANCTTLVFSLMRRITEGLPLDHRLLLTGLLPGYVHDHGGLVPGYSLRELRCRGEITRRARACHDAPDFSRRIREGVPGWESSKAEQGVSS